MYTIFLFSRYIRLLFIFRLIIHKFNEFFYKILYSRTYNKAIQISFVYNIFVSQYIQLYDLSVIPSSIVHEFDVFSIIFFVRYFIIFCLYTIFLFRKFSSLILNALFTNSTYFFQKILFRGIVSIFLFHNIL